MAEQTIDRRLQKRDRTMREETCLFIDFRGTIALALVGLLLPAMPTLADSAPALETWRHPNQTVIRGLQLWLDAGRQNAARRALGGQQLHDGDKVDIWYDASGHGRHVTQKDSRAQPIFHDAEGVVAVRFDGEQTHLLLRNLSQTYRDITLFLVVTPFANPGDFRAFLAMNETGKNDYISGLTIDQGPAPSERFATLNPEGAGFGGAANLMKGAFDFGTGHRLTIASAPGKGGTRLWIDGQLTGRRERNESRLHMDQLTLGARCYNNEGGPPRVCGFLAGDILEVLIYDRLLD